VDLSEDLPRKLPRRKAYKLAEQTGSYKPKPKREKYGNTIPHADEFFTPFL
jgi:hypothetical protein